MQFSPQQEQAISLVQEWHKSGGKQPFYLAGYAGTGKTTLAKEFASGIGGPVYFGAFTGKASYVLRTKGCPGATTLHRLIYKPAEPSRERLESLREELALIRSEISAEIRAELGPDHPNPGEEVQVRLSHHPLIRKLEEQIRTEQQGLKKMRFVLNTDSQVRHAKLFVVDEISMVNTEMFEDILSFGVPTLCLGDPAQLPPVHGNGYFEHRDPDFTLTEIHRQAAENPIIRMATLIRMGKPLFVGEYGESRVIELSDADPSMYDSHDQVLCGREKRPENGNPIYRANVNRRMRSLRGIDNPHPVPGDKLVCLRNNHDLGLLNGQQWRVDESTLVGDIVRMKISGDEGYTQEVSAHEKIFRGLSVDLWDMDSAEHFDYGYCMTVHKSQGSQWGSVLLLDQSPVFRGNAAKWLYTGLTRAAERVTVIQC